MPLQFGVLGALQVRAPDGSELRLVGPVRRQVLAALLCRANTVVSSAALIEDVWGELAPRSAPKTLQSHIVRLRDELGRNGAPVLRTQAAGYVLDSSEIDAARFEALTTAVDDAAPDAIARLDQALALWRGEAYLEFGDAAFAVGERLRLAELRGCAIDRRLDLALRLGRAASVIGELEMRIAAEPYRERAWEQLMLALYRSGRQADALGAYRRARDLLAADLGVDPGPALRDLETRILRQDEGLLARLPERVTLAGSVTRCPYRGLDGYTEVDADLFVGRERLTAEVAGRVADERLVVLTGPSGSGKSSLLEAGLVPALRGGAVPGSAGWRLLVTAPAALAEATGSGGGIEGVDLVVLDRAEELVTVLGPAERERVGGVLRARVERGERVALAVRADFLDRVSALPGLAAPARNTVLVRPMRDDEVRRAIVEPAARCGISIEPAMLDAVLDEVSGRPGALPLLSVALVRAWHNRSGDILTLAGYRAGGALSGALEAGAEEVWAVLRPPAQPAARRLLTRLAARDGAGWVRRPLSLEEAGDPDVVAVLVERRLLTVAGGRVELVHEALLHSWPRLRGWLDERALAVELLEHLSASARAWASSGRSAGDLYRGPRLRAATDWLAGHPDDPAPVEAEFLAVSAAAVEAELHSARARADREARGRRRLRVVVAALGVALLGALAAAGLAVRAQHDARESARRAAAAALVADASRLAAESLAAPDLRTRLLLAAAGYRLQPSVDTRSALLTVLEQTGGVRWLLPTAQRVQWVGAAADASQVWIADNRGQVTRYDARTRRTLSSFADHAARVHAVSPDGRLLVVSGGDPLGSGGGAGVAWLLDARTGRVVRVLDVATPDGPAAWHTAGFTGDGRRLVMLTARGAGGGAAVPAAAVAVYDVTHLDRAPQRLRLAASATALALGRSSFAVATAARSLEVVDAATLRVRHAARRAELPDRAGDGALTLALSPDGSRIAVGTGAVELVSSAALAGAATPVRGAAPEVVSMGFAPAGASLALGASSGAVQLVDTATGAVTDTRDDANGSVLGLAWAGPDLFTGGLDSQLVSWLPGAAARMLRLGGPSRPVGAYGIVADRLVGYYPLPTTAGGVAAPRQVRLLAAQLSSGRTSSWPLGLAAGESVEHDSRDAAAHWALVSIASPQRVVRCELWRLADGVRVASLPIHAASGASGICLLARDASTALVATGAHRLTGYLLPSFARGSSIDVEPRGPAAQRDLVVPLGYTPRGQLVVWAADNGPDGDAPSTAPPTDQLLDLVDPATGRVTGQAGLGAKGSPETLAFSPDRSRLLVGTDAGRISLYAITAAGGLAPVATDVPAADGAVFAATFAPDGSEVVTTGSDGTLRFFDGASLAPIGPPVAMPASGWTFGGFDGHGDEVGGLAATPGGRQRHFIFPGDPDRWAAMACDIAGSQLSSREWARYVGDRPYRAECP